MHLNVRSLYKKLDQITCLYSNVDFLCCSETWLTDKYDDSSVNIKGMSIFRNDRCNASEYDRQSGNIPKRGGGVAIYVGDKWSAFVDVYKEGTQITSNFETVTIIVKKPNNRFMTVMCVYKPPTGSTQKLLEFLYTVTNDPIVTPTELWIVGDFNINFTVRNNPDVIRINRFLKETNLRQLISDSTRLTNRGGSCIDWIITSSSFLSKSGVLNDLLSDHFPVYAVRKKGRECVKKVRRKVRIYKHFDADVYGLLIDKIDWEKYYSVEDPDIIWDMIYVRIVEILEVMCPYKNIFIREVKTPWFTHEIYECIRKRSHYVHLFRSTQNGDILAISKYFRNRCNKLVREAKREFIKGSLDAYKHNPTKFWRELNKILRPAHNANYDVDFCDVNTGEKVPSNETSNYLNNYFANIGARKSPVRGLFDEHEIHGEFFEIGNVRIGEVSKLIAEIDEKKDSCIEGVSTKVLKATFSRVPNAVRYLFSISLKTGIFPRKWAIGFINILPKGGDKTNPSNWRPITQTCVPAKLLEKIVQSRLVRYLDENNIMSKCQFGFRKGRSTQQAIFEILKDAHCSLNRDGIMGLLFLDISKAFDSLDHKLLLSKLRKISLARNSMEWFTSYLDRMQVVRHNGNASSPQKFTNGIPQGSCLGPTLFIFYINSIFKYLNGPKVLMFADDCVLYKSGTNWGEIRQCLQDGLNMYTRWGDEYNLCLNARKSKAMLICNNVARTVIGSPAPFHAGNREILFVRKYCYLGCIIDDELTMLHEYKAVYRKAESKIFMLGKLRYFVDSNTALLIYKQTILPYFDYGGFILVSSSKGQKKDLQTLQNNALRICLRYKLVDRISERKLHEESRLQSLEQRRSFQLLKLMYYHSKDVGNLKLVERPTRGGIKIVFDVPTKCNKKYLDSPYYKGTQLWNDLTNEVQRLENIVLFDKKVRPMFNLYRA